MVKYKLVYMNTIKIAANNACIEGFLQGHTSFSGLTPFVSHVHPGAFGPKRMLDLGPPGELSFTLMMLMAAASGGHCEP